MGVNSRSELLLRGVAAVVTVMRYWGNKRLRPLYPCSCGGPVAQLDPPCGVREGTGKEDEETTRGAGMGNHGPTDTTPCSVATPPIVRPRVHGTSRRGRSSGHAFNCTSRRDRSSGHALHCTGRRDALALPHGRLNGGCKSAAVYPLAFRMRRKDACPPMEKKKSDVSHTGIEPVTSGS